MKNIFKNARLKELSCEKGLSLIEMAFFISVIGLLSVPAIRMYSVWDRYHSATVTDEKIDYVQNVLQQYLTMHGRYPCPASLVARIDDPAYGVEVATDCRDAAFAGTFHTVGQGGRGVRTGAVPVRTLNISDSYGHDSYGYRLIYAVTENYAVEGVPATDGNGAISIVDSQGNSATSVPGNIVQTVYSMGWDVNGAYNIHGVQIEACDPAAASGENCDFDANAIFRNSINKSMNENNLFVPTLSYVPPRTVLGCQSAGAGTQARHNTFLVDTSSSMSASGDCPASMPGCSRMDAARWAMRRVVPARIYNNSQQTTPGQTSITGFVAKDSTANVENNLGDIIFNDPTAPGYTEPDEGSIQDALETKLESMCTDFGTPLGIHIMALANRLGEQIKADIANGGDPDTFSKITVISDGRSKNGIDPVAAAQLIAKMKENIPPVNIQVDIIDIVGDPSLAKISEITGGAYYSTASPDELLDALYSSAGTCASYAPAAPTDKPGCRSKGNWWK